MVPKATCLLPETGHEEKVNLLCHYATQVKDDTRFPQCHPSLQLSADGCHFHGLTMI